MHSIGLTGGIASGKSTVSGILTTLSARIIDADKLGHRTYEPGARTYQQVRAAFGPDVVAADGSIDRKILGSKVFGRPDQMKRLTDAVWPGIRELARQDLDALARDGVAVAVLEAAVLIEAGWQDLVDEVWVVTVPPDVARQRLMARNGFTAAEADARIQSQISNAERLAHADVVLDTNGSLAEVEHRVRHAWEDLRQRMAGAS